MNSIDTRSVLLSATQAPSIPASSDRELLRALLLDASPLPKEAPAEVLLLRLGLNRTVHGDLWLDAEGARACLDYEAWRGVNLSWDVAHESEPTSATYDPDADSRGLFSLRWDGAALWASAPRFAPFDVRPVYGIQWGAETAERIKARRLSYVSPSVRVQDQGGRARVVKVTSAALTNDPATLGARPLLLTANGDKMTLEQLLAALRAGGATEQQLEQARAQWAAGEQARAVNLSAADLRAENEALKSRLEKEARERVLTTYKDRYQEPERAFLLSAFDAVTLESYLKARKPSAQEPAADGTPAEPLHLTNPNQPGPRVTGGSPRGWLNRPWEQLPYKARAALFASDRATYDALRARAEGEGRPVNLVSKEAAETFYFPSGAVLGRNGGRAVHLATGVTPSADVVEVIPEVLTDAIQAGFAGVKALSGSPAVVSRGTLPAWGVDGGPIKGGSKVKIPYWLGIGDFEEVTTEASPPTTIQKLESEAEEASVKHLRLAVTLTYEAQSFAAPGSDPYSEAARQMVQRAELAMDSALIAAARTTSLALDISGDTPGTIDYEAVVKWFGLFGDEEQAAGGLAMLSMHSNGLRQARLVRDDNGLPIFTSPRQGEAPLILGVPVKTSDANTTASGKHVALAIKPGALALWYNASKLRVQSFHDVSTDFDLNAVHLYFAPYLYKRLPGLTKPGAAKLTYNPLA